MSLGRRSGAALYRSTTRIVIGALTTLLVVGPFAFAGVAQTGQHSTCQVPSQIMQVGPWERIKAPAFSAGTQAILDYAVTPTDFNRVFITNGTAVLRTFDGGCHWDESFSLAALPGGEFPYSSVDSTITEVHVSAAGLVYVGVAQVGAIARPHVAISNDGGENWTAAGGLETLQGRPDQISAAISNPAAVYMLVSLGSFNDTVGVRVQAAETIARSQDGGVNWDAGSTQAGGIGIQLPGGQKVDNGLGIDGIQADPRNPNEVWAFGRGGLFHSTDSGTTVAPVAGVPPGVGALDVYRLATGAPARVLASEAASRSLHRSDNTGQTFTSTTAPGVIESIAPGIVADEYALNTDAGVFITGPNGFIDISPPDRQQMVSLESVVGATASVLYGRTGASLERYAIQMQAPPQLPDLQFPVHYQEICDGTVCRPFKTKLGLMEPANEVVRIPRGRTRTLPYTVTLPETPTPLDVHFLVDVSGSMQPSIDGVKAALADIITTLRASGIDVWFGVGEYRSYTDDPAYNKILEMQEPSHELEAALNSLQARGGGLETQLAALFQTATGKGQEGGGYIPPGQQTHFRPGSLKVILHVTDEPFSTGPPHPSFEQVQRALNTTHILQTGLAIQDLVTTTLPSGNDPRDGLERVARGSGALAPFGGVDCDGNGTAEIPEGQPVVCIVDPARASEASVMAPAIVNMLRALKDIGSVDMRVKTPFGNTIGEAEVVEEVAPRIHTGIDFKQDNELTFDVTFSCPRLKDDDRFPVTLVATDEGRVLARTEALVKCLVPEPPPPPPPPVIPLPFIPLALIPPPLPRPPDIIPNPNPNPQPQPASQPQANPQGAFASQEQEQPQLAFAAAGPEEEIVGEKVEEYSMSSYEDRRQPESPEFLYMAGALSMAFMFGWASVARERAKVRTARVRR